ncbi:putative transporter [Agaricicola taiwanensis]|uniref:Putative transporter n=1 Tax=Agaricicola taiwanensis TaxID=591372 RepID=A0A8J2YNC0_9RHOB|nr:LysE family transporter [Agaricicola taiwanensis]GGE55441.1 putative transporter [Agaricicola taiwanensis]
MTSFASVFAQGFLLSATLIMAIGAQNMFVLRHGLQRRHVGPIVLFCAAADAVLIAAGVAGLGALLSALPSLALWLTLGGVIFLGSYGVIALRRALQPGSMIPGTAAPLSLAQALGTAAGFTFLNPHVYLDTVLLVGAVGSGQPPALQPVFVLGAATASFAWFASLGYGAQFLAPFFARPLAWRVLDIVVGLVMLGLAGGLLLAVRSN